MTYEPIQHPNKIVSVELIKFLRKIFKQNFDVGNWHIDPDTNMYIREDYPEDIEEVGIKPGIVVGEYGQVRKGIDYLGKVGYSPMDLDQILNGSHSEEVFTGRFNLKSISETQDEAQSMAYLATISIDHFLGYLVGKRGIHHINALEYTKATPKKGSSRYLLWESSIPVDYVISKTYALRRNIGSPILEGVDFEFDAEGNEEFDGTGTSISKFTSNKGEDYQDPKTTIQKDTENKEEDYQDTKTTIQKDTENKEEDYQDTKTAIQKDTENKKEDYQGETIKVIQETKNSKERLEDGSVSIESFFEGRDKSPLITGVKINSKLSDEKSEFINGNVVVLKETINYEEKALLKSVIIKFDKESMKGYEKNLIKHSDQVSSIEEILIEDFKVSDDEPLIIDIDAPEYGILSTVYVEADNELILEIYADDVLEYRSKEEALIYDIPNILYTGTLKGKIITTKETNVTFFRVRILKI